MNQAISGQHCWRSNITWAERSAEPADD